VNFIEEAKARGFFHQCTDETALDELMNTKKIAAYIGFDATADSLHVGSMVQIMMLKLLQKHGHKAHIVLGGATTMIGDPSFRDTSRAILSQEKIADNQNGILNVFQRVFDTSIIHNNLDWFKDIRYLDLIAEIGPHFNVNRLLSFDSVKNRLEREQGLSFLEFNYAIMQSYDFRHLFRMTEHNPEQIVLQMGGSDQWGNIVSGIDLIRKTDKKTVYGLTAPLITMSNGEKMGKTAAGAVWLSQEKLTVYDYWKFWRNVPDADVGKFLRLFTELSLETIEELEKLTGVGINAAKIVLANEATAIVHGLAAAQKACETASEVFQQKISEYMPKFHVSAKDLKNGCLVKNILCDSGLTESKSAAARLILNGGVKINEKIITDEWTKIFHSEMKISVGKKKHILIKVM
jgi:tyrosyl-tRNA synthetase